MKFNKSGQHGSQMPEVNLVPMMDVVMTILTFFIIVSMTLTAYRAKNTALPEQKANVIALPDPLLVELNPQGRMNVKRGAEVVGDNQDESQVFQQVRSYLSQYPTGSILLKPTGQVPYDLVVKMHDTLSQENPDKVALALSDE
jgi:biopolymer transport protein ExbD